MVNSSRNLELQRDRVGRRRQIGTRFTSSDSSRWGVDVSRTRRMRPRTVGFLFDNMCFHIKDKTEPKGMKSMTPMKKYIRSLISLVVGIASLLQARSETIFIANHSFENPRFADGEYSVNAVPGWVGGGTWFHVANSPEYWFAGTSPTSPSPGPIDGLNIAGINTGNRSRIGSRD